MAEYPPWEFINAPLGGVRPGVVAYGNGKFTILGSDTVGGPNSASTSVNNGDTWTEASWGETFSRWISLAYGEAPALWVASKSDGNIFSSQDGLNWTNTASLGSGKLTYGNGIFVYVEVSGGTFLSQVSLDGIIWDSFQIPGVSGNLVNVIFNPESQEFIGFAQDSNVSPIQTYLFKSSNGESWSVSSGIENNFIFNFAYDGLYFYIISFDIALGNRGISRSSDGINWTDFTSISPKDYSLVLNDSIVYAIVSDKSGLEQQEALYSVDHGLTWQPLVDDPVWIDRNDVIDSAFGGNTFIAVGRGDSGSFAARTQSEPEPTSAMQLFFDNVQDKKGNAIEGADVLVTNYPDGTAATIYSANDPIPANEIASLQTDDRGLYQFYAPDGRYSITVKKNTTTLFSIDDFQIISDAGTGGQVNSVVGGDNIDVDATDPVNPIVKHSPSQDMHFNDSVFLRFGEVDQVPIGLDFSFVPSFLIGSETIDTFISGDLASVEGAGSAFLGVNAGNLLSGITFAESDNSFFLRVGDQPVLSGDFDGTNTEIRLSHNGTPRVVVNELGLLLDYALWPDADGPGALFSDGAGTLTWEAVSTGGQVDSVVGGVNVSVNSADPANPIVSVPSVGVESVVAGTNVTVDSTDPANPIVSASAPGAADIIAYKTTDTARADTATLAPDPELQAALLANTTYAVEGIIRVSEAGVDGGGFRYAFGVGGTFPLNRGIIINEAPADLITAWESNSTTLNAGLTPGTPAYIQVRGTVEVGASDQTWDLQWSQETSDPDATTVHLGSYFIFKPVVE